MRATISEEGRMLDRPAWAGDRQIDERKFCRDFYELYPMVYTEGHFFSVHGMEPEEKVRKNVYDYLCLYYNTNLPRLVSGLIETMKMEFRRDHFDQSQTVIHVANGTLRLGQGLDPQKEPCRCRLPVNYNVQAPAPGRWLQFLNELLEPEDICTLQEYLGYCLVPVNYGQKMLILVGNGGEGKSRIGVMLSHLMGDAMCNGSLTKLETNRFARADLQNRLVMVDDDLQMEALTTTGNIKSIVTAEQRMDLERKGVQSYQGLLFCRLLAFGNGTLRSLHDRSHGFFRRQIILTVKPRPVDRQDDPYLAQRMRSELEGIFLWMLDGLERLLQNDMRFSISPRAMENLNQAKSDGNHVPDFLRSTGYIRLDTMAQISARRLYAIYTDWCEDNTLVPFSARTFITLLRDVAEPYGLHYTTHIADSNSREVRGFQGIRGLL